MVYHSTIVVTRSGQKILNEICQITVRDNPHAHDSTHPHTGDMTYFSGDTIKFNTIKDNTRVNPQTIILDNQKAFLNFSSYAEPEHLLLS